MNSRKRLNEYIRKKQSWQIARHNALDVYRSSQRDLEKLSLADVFDKVASINNALRSTYPCNYNSRIDDRLIEIEIEALYRLTNLISTSEAYKNFITHITRKTFKDINAKRLSKWNNFSNKEKKKFLEEVHQSLIIYAKQHLGLNTQMARKLKPAKIIFKSEPKVTNPLTNKSLVLHGKAANQKYRWPDNFQITLNTNHDAIFHDAEKIFGILAHETMHCIEGHLGHMFEQYPEHVPLWLRHDAENFHLLDRQDGSISSRIYIPYRNQFNEILAQLSQEYTNDIVKEKISAVFTPPAPLCSRVVRQNHRALVHS